MKKFFCILLTAMLAISSVGIVCASDDEIKTHMLNNYTKAARISGMYSFNGYCAACVSYQLMAYGINKSYVYGNGNESYANYSSITRSSGGWYTKSYPSHTYSIKNVLETQNTTSYGSRYYPIVLGFNKGTASRAGQSFGHTMMIYAVRDGKVYFTDSTMPVLSSNIYCLTIDEFCERYSDDPQTAAREFVYDGAVVFYNSSPDIANISVSTEQAGLWMPVNFKFSAPGATTYSLGVDKDGVRVQTVHLNNNTYTSLYGEPGTYTAYISASNVFGSTDSEIVSFRIFGKPHSAYINADKQTAAAGESVTFTYGAEDATSYSVGIYCPDGSYEVVHTGDLTSLSRTFTAPGVYSVFVSCCSVGGYTDTDTVTIEVY